MNKPSQKDMDIKSFWRHRPPYTYRSLPVQLDYEQCKKDKEIVSFSSKLKLCYTKQTKLAKNRVKIAYTVDLTHIVRCLECLMILLIKDLMPYL